MNKSEFKMNLRNLKRTDPAIDQILSSASQVAIYHFVDSDWYKMNIEGSLFVVSRTSSPLFSFIVNNRLHTENMIEPITGLHELKQEEPFLLLKTHKNDIYCIWFYQGEECKAVSNKISEIIKDLQNKELPKQNGDYNSEPLENKLALLGLNTGSNAARPDTETSNNVPISNILSQLFPSQSSSSKTSLIKNGRMEDLQNLGKEFSPIKPINTSNPPMTPNSRSVNLADLFNGKVVREKSPSKAFAQISNNAPVDEMVLTPAMLLKQYKTPGKEEVLCESQLLAQPVKQIERDSSPPILSQQLHALENTQLFKPDAFKQGQLSMEQLKKTLVYLLQNDADFLHHIHSTYVKTISKS